MALLAHAMAVENADTSPPTLSKRKSSRTWPGSYGVRQAPLTIINEFATVAGMVGQDELLEKVLQAGVASGGNS